VPVFLARPRLDDVILVEDAPERSYAETAADAPGNLDTPTAAVYEPLVI